MSNFDPEGLGLGIPTLTLQQTTRGTCHNPSTLKHLKEAVPKDFCIIHSAAPTQHSKCFNDLNHKHQSDRTFDKSGNSLYTPTSLQLLYSAIIQDFYCFLPYCLKSKHLYDFI